MMTSPTYWSLRCSFEGCRAEFSGLATTPTEFSLLAEDAGWTFPRGWGAGYAYAAVYASGESVHCPAHSTDNWDDWTDEKARYEATCATCREDYKGTQDACEEWADDHRCEPDTSIRKIESVS